MPARASVKIDAGELGDASASVAQRIKSRADTQLREAEVLPAQPGDPIIDMVIVPAPGGAGGYLIQVAMMRDDAMVEGTDQSVACELCTEGELVQKANKIIAELIPKIPRDDPDAAAMDPVPVEPEPEPAAPTEPGPSGDDTGPSRPGKKIGKLGYAGIGVGVGGLVLVGVGVPLALQETREDGMEKVDYRPPGYALIGVGAAAVVAGAVMIAIDVTRRKKQRRQALLVPTLAPGFTGASLVGRF